MSRIIFLSTQNIGHYIGLDRPLVDSVLEQSIIGASVYDTINPVPIIYPNSIDPILGTVINDVGLLAI